jgi:16S rRNA (cytidine1402-2'-O)-methyltransferase
VHRIAASVADLIDAFGGDRDAFIGREITKMHEQCIQGSLAELGKFLDDGTIVQKGEFVIIVAANRADVESAFEVDVLLRELAVHLPAKETARIAATVTGLKKNALYERLLVLKSDVLKSDP